ncbi:MAG: hypothetical protein HY391_02070 [Deltaproteobacteria bacterium]|nr:hypothetical protein [Deltaproteobacteria bacterium]
MGLLFRKMTVCLSIAALLAAPLSGCQFSNVSAIDQAVDEVVPVFFQRRAALIEKIRTVGKLANERVNALPVLEEAISDQVADAEEFVRLNQEKIETYLTSIEEPLIELRKIIWSLSKEVYESSDAERIFRDDALLFFALQYQIHAYQSVLEAATPLLFAFAHPHFDSSERIRSFRDILIRHFTACLGMTLVLSQDVDSILRQMHDLASRDVVHPAWVRSFAHAVAGIAQSSAEGREKIERVNEKIPSEKRDEFLSSVAEIYQKFNNASTLYSPYRSDSVGVNILVWFGNLTLGSFNTFVGLGVILFCMIASPFSPAIDFPTFSISQSGNQLHVAVGRWTYKYYFSLGLFEFASGSDAASDHEGGHAKQSMVLGPLYLLFILGSYAIEGLEGGLMERWAKAWAYWG